MLCGWEVNRQPSGKYRQPAARFMASVTCGLTAQDREQRLTSTLVSSKQDYLYYLFSFVLISYQYACLSDC